MPAGRKQVDYTDIRYDAITMKIDGVTIVYDGAQVNGAAAATIGKAVSLSAADTVQLAADADAVFGKLLKVEADGFCTVQRWGMATLPGGNAATLTLGTQVVGALGAASARGYVRTAASATAAELGKQRGFIVNAAVTTDVVVDLG